MRAQATTKREPSWNKLVSEHERFEVLLAKLLAASETDSRADVQTIWKELDAALLFHLDEEEKEMIPALQRVAERDALALLDAHHHLRRRLRELGAAIHEDVVRRNLARDFIEELRDHSQHEERMLDLWTR